MKRCTKCQDCKSHWFSVLRGTGQGRVIYPPFYFIFINALMYELEESELGMCFNHINCCCPTVADDVVLISFSKAAM